MPWMLRYYDCVRPGVKGRKMKKVEVVPTFSFRKSIPVRTFIEANGVFITPVVTTIELGSDDGSRLWLNGIKLIDNWGLHAYRVVRKRVTLPPVVVLKLEAFNWGGPGLVTIRASPPIL